MLRYLTSLLIMTQICLVGILQLSAQKIEVELGDRAEYGKDNPTRTHYLGFNQKNHFVFTYRNSKYRLDKYNPELNLISSVELNIEDEKKNYISVIKGLIYNGRPLILGTAGSTREKKQYLYANLGNKNGDISPNFTIIDEFPIKYDTRLGEFHYFLPVVHLGNIYFKVINISI